MKRSGKLIISLNRMIAANYVRKRRSLSLENITEQSENVKTSAEKRRSKFYSESIEAGEKSRSLQDLSEIDSETSRRLSEKLRMNVSERTILPPSIVKKKRLSSELWSQVSENLSNLSQIRQNEELSKSTEDLSSCYLR